MELQIDREDNTLIAKTEGRIDGLNSREFDNALKSVILDTDSNVILDFEDLSYISSAGLRIIRLTSKALWVRNAKLRLCSLSGPIKEIFEISGFDKIIPIYTSREEAIAALDR